MIRFVFYDQFFFSSSLIGIIAEPNVEFSKSSSRSIASYRSEISHHWLVFKIPKIKNYPKEKDNETKKLHMLGLRNSFETSNPNSFPHLLCYNIQIYLLYHLTMENVIYNAVVKL